MFELPDMPVLGDLTDTALIDMLEHRTRTEAMAAAQRLAAIGEIWARHCLDEDDASAHCAIDGWESANAEISAACHLTRGAASRQMSIARALRERLPKVAAVFQRGEISAKVAATITWRTALITDDDAVALVDTALAGAAVTYGTLSETKVEQAIDVWVDKFDRDAVRRSRTAARGRDVHFGSSDDPSGTVSIWGRLLATDAAMLQKLLNTMAREVCENDPRSMGQRRADSLGAIAAGADHLTCLCGSPTCDATGVDPRSRSVVIHLLAHLRPQWAYPGNTGNTPDDGGPDGGGPDGGGTPDDDGGTPEGDGGNGDDGGDRGDHHDADCGSDDHDHDEEDQNEAGDGDGGNKAGDAGNGPATYGLTEMDLAETDPADGDYAEADAAEADAAGVDGAGVYEAPADNRQPAPPTPTALAPAHPSGPPRDPRIHGTPSIADLANDAIPTITGGPAIILGGGIVPTPLLAELIATGAKLDYLTEPDNLTPDRYRPSTKLAAFVRMRDLMCMFPGCGVSATRCDLDHTVPWPQGATHPGNLGSKCRNHHLLKTFRVGDGGWTDEQHPDGSHTWTAPTGHIYHTTPFSRILFPDWNPHTPAPPPKPTPDTTTNRDMKMPQRKRTRQQTRAQRINAERRHNTEHDKPPPY